MRKFIIEGETVEFDDSQIQRFEHIKQAYEITDQGLVELNNFDNLFIAEDGGIIDAGNTRRDIPILYDKDGKDVAISSNFFQIEHNKGLLYHCKLYMIKDLEEIKA